MAYARMSIAMTTMATRFLGGTAQRQLDAQARAAADTALQLDPDLAEAHGARGWLLTAVDFDHAGAETEFRRAVQLAPKDGDALFNLGQLMGASGQPEQAIALTRQALATDPLNAESYFRISQYLLPLGRFDEAQQSIRKAIELQPEAAEFQTELTIVEVLRGDATAALAAAQQERSGLWQDVAMAIARQVGSDRAAADAALKTVIDKDANSVAYQIAQIYAFAWLDRAWANRDGGINLLLFDPFILRYKDDPRFAAFCRKVGLPTPADVAAAAVKAAPRAADHPDPMPSTTASSGHAP
jgi:Tfp pilus assembly protein PilF